MPPESRNPALLAGGDRVSVIVQTAKPDDAESYRNPQQSQESCRPADFDPLTHPLIFPPLARPRARAPIHSMPAVVPFELIEHILERVSVVDIASRYVTLTRRGREHVGLCPFHNELTPSFTANDAKRFFYCFGCGVHGDVIEFMMRIEGLPFRDATVRLSVEAGLTGGGGLKPVDQVEFERRRERRWHARKAEARETKAKQQRALEIWRSGQPIADTPAEPYLRSRGIDPVRLLTDPPGWPETLRWTEDADMLPRSTKRAAMICAVNSRHHHMLVAIHRHFLNSDGTPVLNANDKKLKLSLGPVDGNAIELSGWPFADGRWGLAEGVETALCVEAAFQMPCYAAISAGNLSKVKPPAWATDATIFADNDESETGIREAGKALAAFRAMPQFGRRVRVLMADAVGLDFADLMGRCYG